jgi:hypothetical protein
MPNEENPMSDYNNNRDPFNPVPPGGSYDPYGNSRFEPADSGRGPYILLAILVAIGVIGGLLYFNHSPANDQQAQAPAATHSTTTPGPTPLNGPTANPTKPGATTAPGATTPTPSPSGNRQ